MKNSYPTSNEKTPNNLIPRNVLFGNPNKALVRLSHDGNYIAYKAPYNNVLNIFIAPSSSPNEAQPITNDTHRGISSYFWGYDNEHIIFTKDNGNENTKLYSYNIITTSTNSLTSENPNIKASVYKTTHLFPDEIVIGINDRDPKYFDLYRLNIKTNQKTILLENHEYSSFIIDDYLNIRLSCKRTALGGKTYYKLDNNSFVPFLELDFEESMNSSLLNANTKGQTLYMLDSRGRDTTSLVAIDLEQNTQTILASGNQSDLSILTRDPVHKTIQAVYENYTTQTYTVLDNEIKQDIEILKLIEKGDFSILSRTIDDKKWLVCYDNDTAPLKYYYYNRDNKTSSYLFSDREELENFKLSPMHPVKIPTDDGLVLVCYLTLPESEITTSNFLQSKTPLPTVICVHGGPWSRDYWGLNKTHQWLADRGYAVLSVNYRGSSGFGKDFCNAGNLQWGKKMQEDILTAANWAIDNNFALKDKIAIYGGSYGGFAALTGLTLTPDFFACAIDLVGPSNLVTLGNSFPPYWASGKEIFKKSMGDWTSPTGIEELVKISPLTHVKNITKPLLIVHGDKDSRVTKAESDQIYDAMVENNLPALYIRYTDEGHGLVRASNQKSFRAIMEKFLAKFLGGHCESFSPDDFIDSNLLVNHSEIDKQCLGRVINDTIEEL